MCMTNPPHSSAYLHLNPIAVQILPLGKKTNDKAPVGSIGYPPEGIVDELAQGLLGGWIELSKTPITANPVLCFWVKLHSAPE